MFAFFGIKDKKHFIDCISKLHCCYVYKESRFKTTKLAVWLIGISRHFNIVPLMKNYILTYVKL